MTAHPLDQSDVRRCSHVKPGTYAPAGTRFCRNLASKGSDFCWCHQPVKAGKLGGAR